MWTPVSYYCEDSSDQAHAIYLPFMDLLNLSCSLFCTKLSISNNFLKFFVITFKQKQLLHWNKIRHVCVFFIPQLDNHEIKPGKSLKVNISVPNLRLFVGNIPKSRGKEEILEEFGKLTGKVNSRRVLPTYLPIYLPVYLYTIWFRSGSF